MTKFYVNQFETSELGFWEAVDEQLLIAAKRRYGSKASAELLEEYMDDLNNSLQANVGRTGGYVLNGKVFKVIEK